MIKKFLSSKTSVFIDASNIYHSQKRLGWQIDFKKLQDYFKSEIELHKIYFYTAHDPESDKQHNFFNFLDIVGYSFRTKKVKFIKDKSFDEGGFHKGNLDVELTIDAVYTLDEYNSATLLSGDSDFEPLIKFLKAQDKRCLIMSTKGRVALELIKQAKFIDLKKIRKHIERK